MTYIFSWKCVLRTLLGIASVDCLEFGIGQSGEREREIRLSDEDGDSKRLKIIFLFTRRYLGNRKSYRDESKSVLKVKIPRFWWSFIRWPRVIIFGVIAIQSFSNFNRDWNRVWGKRLKITFLFTRRYLGNRKSYRDKRKSILKSKFPRF